MARTLNPILEAALLSGNYDVYMKGLLKLSGVLTFTLNTILEYRISPSNTLDLKAQFTYGVDDYDQLDTVCIRRGVTVGGNNYYIDTSDYTITEAYIDGFYITIKAELLPVQKVSTPGDDTYENVLDAVTSDLNFTATFIGTGWDSQVLPSGKTLNLNKAKFLQGFLKQKLFANYADNDSQSLRFYKSKDTPSTTPTEYTITTDRLVNIQSAGLGLVGLLWRDENNTIFKPSGANEIYPLYNLGFKLSTDPLPTDDDFLADKLKPVPDLIKPIDVPMNLTYQTGDFVKIISTSGVTGIYQFGHLQVTEYFDRKKEIKWGLTIELWDYIANSEGGALPGTIERVAAYTPLVTTNFNNNLDQTVNNIQALAEAVDELELGSDPGEATHAASASAVTDDDEFGFYETVAALWRKITWANIKATLTTYFDTLYAPISINTEFIQDTVGAMFTGNTETGITVTYDDSDGTIDLTTDVTTSSIREKLTADRTYYVRTDGSDTNTGLANTSGGAFLTIQKAVNVAVALDLSIYSVTINVADGTYSETVTLKSYIGVGPIYITGNTGTPANVLLNSGQGFYAPEVQGLYKLNGFKHTGNGIGIFTSGGQTHVQFENFNFGGTTAQHLYCADHSFLECVGNYTISARTNIHMQATGGGLFQTGVSTCTLTGTPAMSVSFAYANVGGLLRCSLTFSGAGTGKRYTADSLSLIFVNGAGANYFPGNVAGTTATGAQYV